MNTHTKSILVALTTTAALVATAPTALAGNADKVRSGSCQRSTDWKVKVGPDNGRLEVEAEVDSNRNGQTWRWRIVHNGSVSASGTRHTRAPSGSFTVRRMVVNRRGTDTITFRARNPRSGEVCRGTVNF